ncbi:protein kinase family protein [Parendozoicomonas sp. Alg238-R29]|uniref:protein kinase family protein n=1 Tax=Parendozoicomonas sp. Alg238-R29 TaxID=2993446 RepID=UPI00248D7866|nr:protein kinase family protein [Parendozoicomonas sp. Alg238-R29]
MAYSTAFLSKTRSGASYSLRPPDQDEHLAHSRYADFCLHQVRPYQCSSSCNLYLRKNSQSDIHAHSITTLLSTYNLKSQGVRQRLAEIAPWDVKGERNNIQIRGIGLGGFAAVVACRESTEAEEEHAIAVKIAHVPTKSDATLAQANNQISTEIAGLTQFNHDNIISLLGFMEDTSQIPSHLLIMPLCTSSLKECQKLTGEQQERYCLGLTAGLSYLHKQSYCHRDIKLANCLISTTGVLKISDMGMLIAFDKTTGVYKHTQQSGTRNYLPPEAQKKDSEGQYIYGAAGDSYAAALVMGQITDLIPRVGNTLPAYRTIIPNTDRRMTAWHTPADYLQRTELLRQSLTSALTALGGIPSIETWLEQDQAPFRTFPFNIISETLTPPVYALIIAAGLREDISLRLTATRMHECLLSWLPEKPDSPVRYS